MYFDQIPSTQSTIHKKKRKIIFSDAKDEGKLEYIFAGKDNLLVEKRFFKKNRKLWSVHYYEYLFKDGNVFPQGIVLNNYVYKYKLIVNMKDII